MSDNNSENTAMVFGAILCSFCCFTLLLVGFLIATTIKINEKKPPEPEPEKTPEPKKKIDDEPKNKTPDSKTKITRTIVNDSSVSINSGRYIKIKQPRIGCLNLGEIQVFTKEEGPNLITPLTKVTKSSDYGSDQFPSANLVNNNLRDFTHTSCNDAGEILIDLGDTYDINKIILFNRPDCCWQRAVGIILSILDKDNKTIFTGNPIKDKNFNTTFKEDDTSNVDKVNYYSAFIYNPPNKEPKGVFWMGVVGNNGAVSCEKYCGGIDEKSWNGELPIEWKGAKCVGTIPSETGCQNTFDMKKNPTQCICEAKFSSWNK